MVQDAEELDLLLREPLASVRERERTAFDRRLRASGGRVVLFGAGNLGRKSLKCLRSAGIEPLAFCDNHGLKWGGKLDGVPVLSPEEAVGRYGAEALFVVTVWSCGNSYWEARKQLASLGATSVISTEILRWKFADEMLPELCLDLPHRLYEHRDEVCQVHRILADEISRREFLLQAQWRALGDRGVLPTPDVEESYFPDSLFDPLPEESFVDCGAFVGDTAQRWMERQSGEFGKIIAFEPDRRNFKRLQEWTRKLQPAVAARINIFDYAVGARRELLTFNADGTDGAARKEGGNFTVQCVTLDELLVHEAPTHIKMDIEGAELDALKGAAETIRQHRPVLSICLYHEQNDFWRIPAYLHSLDLDYRLFLRAHEADGWQLVCYAVPPERLAEESKAA